jgi:hypothetical protein
METRLSQQDAIFSQELLVAIARSELVLAWTAEFYNGKGLQGL